MYQVEYKTLWNFLVKDYFVIMKAIFVSKFLTYCLQFSAITLHKQVLDNLFSSTLEPNYNS